MSRRPIAEGLLCGFIDLLRGQQHRDLGRNSSSCVHDQRECRRGGVVRQIDDDEEIGVAKGIVEGLYRAASQAKQLLNRRILRRKSLSPGSFYYPTGGNRRASLPVAGRRSMSARWQMARSTRAISAQAEEVSWCRANPESAEELTPNAPMRRTESSASHGKRRDYISPLSFIVLPIAESLGTISPARHTAHCSIAQCYP